MSRERRAIRSSRPPFWLPASTFYFLTSAVTIAVFFLTWAIMAEAEEDNPWIVAGLIGSIVMIAGVVLREVILRHRRESLYFAQRRIDTSILSMPVSTKGEAKKLTLEQNIFLLQEIKKKSEAAKVLGNLAESHREVFALCAQYIVVAARELPTIGVGSPRLAAVKRGRDTAERLHKYHMLKWAELEIKSLSVREPLEGSEDGLKRVYRALSVAEEALDNYPNEAELIQSRAAIQSYIALAASRDE